MKDPEYVDRWVGLGRDVRLTIEHRVQLYVCSLCAALVVDRDTHTRFHRQVQA